MVQQSCQGQTTKSENPLEGVKGFQPTETNDNAEARRDFWNEKIGMWTRIEVYRFLGKDSRSSLYSEKFPVGYMWFWRTLTKNQATTRPENLWPEVRPKRESRSEEREARKDKRETKAR